MDSFERAWEIVADARRTLDRAGAKLDEEAQIELYDLAFSSAELTATEIMLDYAAAAPDERAFKQGLALTFCAEAVSNLQHTSSPVGSSPTPSPSPPTRGAGLARAESTRNSRRAWSSCSPARRRSPSREKRCRPTAAWATAKSPR